MEDPNAPAPGTPNPVEMGLRDSEERLRGILNTAVEGIITKINDEQRFKGIALFTAFYENPRKIRVNLRIK
jgi:hypothetical protein